MESKCLDFSLSQHSYRKQVVITTSDESSADPEAVESQPKDTEVCDYIDFHRIIDDPENEDVQLVNRIVERLVRACVYFVPESADYFENLRVFVVDRSDVNAYAVFGGFVVVNSGLIEYYKELAKQYKDIDVESVSNVDDE